MLRVAVLGEMHMSVPGCCLGLAIALLYQVSPSDSLSLPAVHR